MGMGDNPSPQEETHPPRSNLSILYYGLIIIAATAIVLVLYNFVIIKWCTDFTDHQIRRRTTRCPSTASGVSLISSFEYKNDGSGDFDCAVCLSVFEEGEQVKKLPKCNHSFHAPCIDMWLYSHLDCPLCRSPVGPQHEQVPTSPQQHTNTVQSEHSREILLASAIFS